MPSFCRLKPAGAEGPSGEELAAHVRKALHNIQHTMRVASLVSEEQAEIAAINGACDFLIETLTARANGVQEAMRLRDELVPSVITAKRQQGAF